jgi:hypothetical protein
MNTPNLPDRGETDALRGDLRACEHAPRPIHRPKTGQDATFGGGR